MMNPRVPCPLPLPLMQTLSLCLAIRTRDSRREPCNHTAEPDLIEYTSPAMSLPAARTWISIPIALAISGVAVYYMRLGPAAQAAGLNFEQVMAPGEFKFPGTVSTLRRTYTGFAPLDMGLSFLVAAFYPGVRGAGMSAAFEQQQPYFLMQFGAVLAAMAVEAGRDRNYLTVMSLYARSSRHS